MSARLFGGLRCNWSGRCVRGCVRPGCSAPRHPAPYPTVVISAGRPFRARPARGLVSFTARPCRWGTRGRHTGPLRLHPSPYTPSRPPPRRQVPRDRSTDPQNKIQIAAYSSGAARPLVGGGGRHLALTSRRQLRSPASASTRRPDSFPFGWSDSNWRGRRACRGRRRQLTSGGRPPPALSAAARNRSWRRPDAQNPKPLIDRPAGAQLG